MVAQDLIFGGDMESLDMISLPTQGLTEATSFQAAAPGAQEDTAGFGLLLGGMLSQGQEGAPGGILPPADILKRGLWAEQRTNPVITSTSDGFCGSSPGKAAVDETEEPEVFRFEFRAALDVLMMLFAGVSNTQPGESLRSEREVDRTESRPGNWAALRCEGLSQDGESRKIAASMAAPAEPGRQHIEEPTASVIPVADCGIHPAREGRKGATPVSPEFGAGGESDHQEPSPGPIDAPKGEHAGESGSGLFVRERLQGRKAAWSHGPEALPAGARANISSEDRSPSGNSEVDAARAGLSVECNESSAIASTAPSERNEGGASVNDLAAGTGARSSHAESVPEIHNTVPVSPDVRADSPGTASSKHVSGPARNLEIPSERFVVLRQDESSVRVSVRIENLGKVQIELTTDSGVVNAQIHTSDAAAKSVIESNLGQLLENLAREGVSIGNLEVSLREKREPSGENQDPMTRAEPGDLPAPKAKAPSGSRGLISIYA